MEYLINYLHNMRIKLKEDPYVNFIMEEITNVATDNWIQTGKPNLTKKQLDKAIMKGMSKGTTLN